jgi:signal transduction histidine kinase
MKDIELVLEFGESLNQSGITIIKTDHVRLGQIMTNLISNAIRFTAPSTVRRITTVRLDVAFSQPMPGTCAALSASASHPRNKTFRYGFS